MDAGQLREALWGFPQLLGLWGTSGAELWGPQWKHLGRRTALTSTSSIPTQDSEPRRGCPIGWPLSWREGLAPASFQEEGFTRVTPPHPVHTQLGRGAPQETLVLSGRGEWVLVGQNPMRPPPLHGLKRRVCFLNELKERFVLKAWDSVWSIFSSCLLSCLSPLSYLRPISSSFL